MNTYVYVSRHAQNRYILRVKATGSARRDIVNEWNKCVKATALDLERARCLFDKDTIYRVGLAPNKVRFMMVSKNGTIVTILTFR